MEGLNLYHFLQILWRRKYLFGGTVLLSLVAGIILCVVLPPGYRTEATLVPLKKKISLFSTDLAELLEGARLKPAAKITSVFESRTVRERVIERLNLLPVLFRKKWDPERNTWRLKPGEPPPDLTEGAKVLKKYLTVEFDKTTNTIKLEVEFPRNPELTYQLAQVWIEEAQHVLQEKTFSLAHLSRKTLEKRLREVKAKILQLENIYRDFSTGKLKKVPLLLEPLDFPEQAKGSVSFAQEKEKLEQLRKTLKKELERYERPDFVSAPAYYFNLVKLKAQTEALLELYSLLLREYEMARIEDIRESLVFQVLDPPYKPRKNKPYRPRKFLIMGFALVGGLALALFLVFFIEWWYTAQKENQN